jgi:hypothetical protein
MAFYFGLNVGRNLTDIVDPRQSILNINLDPKDLDRLRGTTDPGGVSRNDFKSLSGLTQDLEKTLGRLNSETSTYDRLTTNAYDENSFIDNNLIVNGQIAATSIKYVYLASDNTIKIADISTSRVSSWSSFETPVTQSTPIFYGGQLDLEGPLELSELVINDQARPKRFESEIPTHKIKVRVNSSDVYLYAMKGIPLVFRGFFRNATLSATINRLGTIRPSWTVTNILDKFEYVFENRLSGSSSRVDFRDSVGKERDIKFYYPVERITTLTLTDISLSEFPSTILPSLTNLNISNNDFREFPNFSGYTSLSNLNVSNNNLTRSRNAELATFSSSIAARLPTSLRIFTAGNCFSGESTIDLSSIPLTTLDISTISNGRRVSGTSPKINGSTIEVYNIASNRFSDIDESVKSSATLKQITLSNNDISTSGIRFDSSVLERFDSGTNRHNLVDVSGKTLLNFYRFSDSLVIGNSSVTNIFDGCSSLRNIDIRNTLITGAIPRFLGCNSLETVDFRFTGVSESETANGGNPPFVIGENTFNACRSTLRDFRVRSSQLSSASQFHPDAFRLMPSLNYLEITSNGQGITGPLPSFATARNIVYILLYSNRLNGTLPNFDNNEQLFFLNLTNNLIEGLVPNIKTTALRHLILTNNRLTTFNEIDSSEVVRIHLGFNNIIRIPNLSNLTKLQELLINNQRIGNNRFSYTTGSFVGLISLRILNITNNSISQGFIDQIILDLSQNYDLNPRTGVTINLRGNTPPSSSANIQDTIKKLQLGGWTVLVD